MYADFTQPCFRINVLLFSQELKEAFEIEAASTGRTKLLLTAAVPAGAYNINNGFDIPNVCR